MNQEQIKYVNEMKAIKAVDELIALAEQAKGFMYKGNFSEARYNMTLISRGSVFALEQIDKVNEVNHD